ncbi:hypothetical protein ADM96_15605 [Burkholderia sp. ST111]|nr:hypothetical protein ADM96_15605 [Burkholderia sp. ST111]
MKIDKQELKAALGWALVAVVLLALSGWVLKADAHPMTQAQCSSLANVGFTAAVARDRGSEEYEQQAVAGFFEGQGGDIEAERWAMHVVHQVFTDPDASHYTPEKVRDEVAIACLASGRSQK